MRHNGFSLVEVLLAMTLAIFAMTVLAGAILYANESLTTGALYVQADWRARECLNVVRWVRDVRGWDVLSTGTYGLSSSSGQWELIGTPDDSGRFVRTLTIGVDEPEGRDVTCDVVWQGQFGELSIGYGTRIASWPNE